MSSHFHSFYRPRHASLAEAKSTVGLASLLHCQRAHLVFLLTAIAARQWRLNATLLAGILLDSAASVSWWAEAP